MADNTEFRQHIIRQWSAALDAIRRAGGHHITVPVADMAVILDAAEVPDPTTTRTETA